jgi:hypothetical protein
MLKTMSLPEFELTIFKRKVLRASPAQPLSALFQ